MEKNTHHIAIKVANLSKKYELGRYNPNLKLSDRLKVLFKRRKSPDKQQEFYALKDLNFTIYKGDTIGLIGRNGAGKSTLLKVLSNITEPTSGKVTIFGTIASVLEVGMGFHPELTGRENVYLSGAMYGIGKEKVKGKFDEIVEFAGMKRFINTPVKHYSSGMYVRLAFSVVVNIDADILLFDEVLSLGDYSFQMKCYDKIRKLAHSHKTIVLVSHNSSDINALCSKVICLDKGRVTDYGDSSISMKYFENAMSTSPPVNEKSDEGVKSESVSESGFENKLIKKWDVNQAPGNERIKITKIFVTNESRKESNVIYTSDTISINFEFEKFFDDDFYDIGYIVSNMNYMFLGNHLGNSKIHLKDYKDKGVYRVKTFIEKDFFNDTVVSISFGIYRNDGTVVYFDVNALHLKIIKDTRDKDIGLSTISKNFVLPLKPKGLKWEINKVDD